MSWSLMGLFFSASILSGAVLGAALGLTGFAILHFMGGGATQLGVQAVFNVFGEFTLTAIPLFILLGDVLVASGLAGGVYRALSPLFARARGGLLHTNIAVCTVFGAVSGSSMSVSAAVGAVAYPELSRRGYAPRLVVGTLAAGGTLGLLIPPSLSLLIYGALTDTSIGKLFLAGVLPGLLMALIFMAYVEWSARRNPNEVPQEQPQPWGPTLRATLPYERRLALSMLTGVPVDPSLDPRILATLQADYAAEPEPSRAVPQFGSVKATNDPGTASERRERGTAA